MESLAGMLSHLLPLSLLIVLGATTPPEVGPEQPPVADAVADALRIEVSAPHRLYCPDRPAWLRFTLHNTSDQPLDIPLRCAPEPDHGITLPLEIIFGQTEEPALFVAYEQDKPVPVPSPVAPVPADSQKFALRLAPHGSVGTEIDLREHYSALRYSGAYRVEWRPLGERAGTAKAGFRVEPRKNAILVTDKGKVTFSLMYDEAPRHVENFLDLIRDGFYDGKTIHKVIAGFVLQGGCPKGDGTGVRPDGKLLPAEFHDAPFKLGTLAMARKPADPNSASCQFFITLTRLPDLDGQYTVIGQADSEESLRTLSQLAAEPTDARHRPRLPLIIRSINLVDAQQGRTTRFDLKPRQSVTRAPAASSGTGSQADQP